MNFVFFMVAVFFCQSSMVSRDNAAAYGAKVSGRDDFTASVDETAS